MSDVKIKLLALWIALMLTYLLGDVLRVYSGDIVPGEIMGKTGTQGLYLAAAAFMLIPILMIVLTVFLNDPVNRWFSIVAAIFMFLFNAVGLPGYKSWYDIFLIVISLLINIATVWTAWRWV